MTMRGKELDKCSKAIYVHGTGVVRWDLCRPMAIIRNRTLTRISFPAFCREGANAEHIHGLSKRT
ncbi:hypothetical protein GOP47_0004292, partial [Adiantum capillus-veneris]